VYTVVTDTEKEGKEMYKIIIAALGQFVEQDETIKVCRSDWAAERLAYNMAHLWAWNIKGYAGYQADGPAVFVEFE
jgi:hypothetical protein